MLRCQRNPCSISPGPVPCAATPVTAPPSLSPSRYCEARPRTQVPRRDLGLLGDDEREGEMCNRLRCFFEDEVVTLLIMWVGMSNFGTAKEPQGLVPCTHRNNQIIQTITLRTADYEKDVYMIIVACGVVADAASGRPDVYRG